MTRAARMATTALRRVLAARHDRGHAKRARAAYNAIVAARPERALTPAGRKRIVEYATERFGAPAYAPWLETYAAWRGEFVEGCMPDNYIGRYIVPYSLGAHPGALRNTFARRILQSDIFPDLAYVFYGRLYGTDNAPLEADALAARAFSDHPYVYLKHASSLRGQGVLRVTREEFARTVREAKAAVIQYPVTPHPDLVALSPDAAATLRVTTVFENGPPRPVAAYLRLGRAGDSHIMAASALRVAVDLDAGELSATGALPDWTPVEAHPDTRLAFAGLSVPGFARALDICCEHHARVPHFRFIGWDATVTESGEIVLFEANAGFANVRFSEACHGPIFAGLGWDRFHLQAPSRAAG